MPAVTYRRPHCDDALLDRGSGFHLMPFDDVQDLTRESGTGLNRLCSRDYRVDPVQNASTALVCVETMMPEGDDVYGHRSSLRQCISKGPNRTNLADMERPPVISPPVG